MDSSQEIPKPRAYADHNILIRLSNPGSEAFCHKLKEMFQIIFSLETINEIRRGVGFEEKMIKVLEDLEASYLDVTLDEDNRISDSASIYKIDLREWMNSGDTDEIGANALIASGQLFSLKMMGGKPNLRFEDIISEQRNSFSALIDKMEAPLKELDSELASEYISNLRSSYDQILQTTSSQLQQHHGSGIGFEGVNLLRSELKVSPKVLNNIKPPNVLQKIWDILKTRQLVNQYNYTLEDIIGISKNLTHPGKPIYVFEKVIAVYGFLNSIGYNSDEDLQKDDGFRSSASDQAHASYGAFSNFLLTWDNRFAKKTKVVYEYLNIGAQVINFNEL